MGDPTCGSYSGDPAANPIDGTRFLLGDTRAPFLVTDGEVQYALDQANGSEASAAASLADSLAARFAGAADVASGGVRRSSSQRAAGYRALAARLRMQRGAVIPTAGGIEVSEEIARKKDPTLVPPSFEKRQDDNPRAFQQDSIRRRDPKVSP